MQPESNLMVQRLILLFLATQSVIKCSVTNDESENEVSVDGKLKKKATISGTGVCTTEYCFEFKPQVYIPHSPLIPCDKVWSDFYECEAPFDLKGNQTARDELGYGCTKFGGQKYEDVLFTQVNCTVLPNIECYGNRTFTLDVPCIKYSGHYFVTTLLYSIFLGFLGMDRFSLGHTGTAVGKLLTLGGVGIWWLVDIVLLVTGHLTPEDGSSWMPVA